MNVLTTIVGGMAFLVIVGRMIIRPYLYYRDLVAGAISDDSKDTFLIQGCVFGAVAIYLTAAIGFQSALSVMTIMSSFLIAGVQFYFVGKIRSWKKNNRCVEPSGGADTGRHAG